MSEQQLGPKRFFDRQVADGFGYTHTKVDIFTYAWTIDNFSFCFELICNRLVSPTFKNGDLEWRLELQPTGDNPGIVNNQKFISLHLKLVSNKTKEKLIPCMAEFYISNTNGKEIRVAFPHCTPYSTTQFPSRSVNLIEKEILLSNKDNFIRDNNLTIYCTINTSSVCDSFSSQISMAEPVSPSILELLFQNPEFSDVTLSVNGTDFPAHKAILATRSLVFKAMFCANMKENRSNRVEIADVDEQTIRELLRFIYTGRVENFQEWPMAGNLFAAADKYELQELKVMCEEQLSQQIEVTTSLQILLLADMHHAKELKNITKKFIRFHILKLAKTNEWKRMLEEHPKLIAEVVDVTE